MAFRRGPTWRGAVLMAAPLLFAAATAAAGQRDAADAGRSVYTRECASCHGAAATGYGPTWRLLRRTPPDLTVLSHPRQPFNRNRTAALVTGRMRLSPPHSPSEMPRWRGALETPLSAATGGVTELDALLDYLASMQRFQPGAAITIEAQAAAGRRLFETHCAACHGDAGRAPRLPGYTVGIGVPDLTTIALRNGGTIDMRKLYESIARGDEHGDVMPAWGRAFRNAGWPDYLNLKNIEAIAWYVESIQRR